MNSKALKVYMLVCALYVAILPLSSALATLIGYMLIVLSVMLPIDVLLCGGNSINKWQLRIVCLLLVIVVAVSVKPILSATSADIEDFVKAFFSFFSFLLTISIGKISYTRKMLDYYFSINRFLSFVFILYTILPLPFRYTIADDYGKLQFTMSMGNPNATATRVMFCICLLLIQFAIINRKTDRVINVVLICGLIYTLIMLQCRTALLCCLIGLSLTIFKVKISRLIASCMWITPLLFVFIQRLFEMIPMFQFLNKSLLTGRDTMYEEFVYQIRDNPFSFVFGNFFENHLENLHNIYFTLAFNVGFVGIILYLAFWNVELSQIRNTNDKLKNYAWITIIMFIIQSSAEAASMSGSFTYGAMIIFLIRLTKDNLITADGSPVYSVIVKDDRTVDL